MAVFAAAIAAVHSAALVISVPVISVPHVAPSVTRTWYGVNTHLTSTPPDLK